MRTKRDDFIEYFKRDCLKNGRNTELMDEYEQNGKNIVRIQVRPPMNPSFAETLYFLKIVSDTTNKEITAFQIQGGIDHIQSLSKKLESTKAFFGFDIIRFEEDISGMPLSSTITIPILTKSKLLK